MDIHAPQRLLDFSGKTVVVTGASRGIGRGIALRFAEVGAGVAVNCRSDEAAAREVAREIESKGGKATVIRADVTSGVEVEALIAATVAAFKGIDVLINNAGSYPLAPLLEMKEAQWDEVIATNLRSAHLCTQAAARQMVQQGGGGAIINLASIEAENPAPRHSHYNAAKAGVLMYTRAAAQELGPHGIRVNAVSPGLIWREGLEEDWPEGVNGYLRAVPLGRLGQAEDVADACLFLASPAARWITGVNLLVDGGVMTHRIF